MDANLQALIEATKATDVAITALKQAFGAPGDYGYDTPKGDALFGALRAQVGLHNALHQLVASDVAARA